MVAQAPHRSTALETMPAKAGRKRSLRAAAATLAAVVSLLAPATNAVAVSSGTVSHARSAAASAPPAVTAAATPAFPTVRFADRGAVRAAGAAAVVRLAVTCWPGQNSYLEVSVQQRLPGRPLAVANGYAYLDTCNGSRQVVSAALEVGNATEDAPFPVSDRPLSASAALAVAETYLCGATDCVDHLYRPQPVTLRYTDDLDRPASATARIGATGRLLDGGAVVSIPVTVSCRHGAPVQPLSTGILYQRMWSGRVQYATPLQWPVKRCDGATETYRVRMYPVVGPLHPGSAFVDFGDIWRQVQLD